TIEREVSAFAREGACGSLTSRSAGRSTPRPPSCTLGNKGGAMHVLHTNATIAEPGSIDDSLTTIVARSVLESALAEGDSAELWFDLGDADGEVSRLAIDLAPTDMEELLGLSSEDEIALSLDGEAIESLFADPDVEAHGLKGAIALAVTSA